ncbi:MAG TPA: hypothetical protein VGM64_00440 [Lacunisphaera sp.]|jgi:hypothetical protein
MNLRTLFIPLMALSAFVISGCASDQSDASTASSAQQATAMHPESVAIKVTGGSDGKAVTASQVANAYFAAGLAKSLTHARAFAKVLPAGSPDAVFQLEVTITPLEPPAIGESMTATVEANWTLTRISNGYVLWQKKISGSHTTDAKEAFTGIERVQLAIEGAVQDNIKDGVSQLGSASLL